MKCGDANPNGNISLFYKGGCKQNDKLENMYRCVGCGGWFHYKCILKHFELEEGHDNARNALKKLLDILNSECVTDILTATYLEEIIQKGLEPNKKLLEGSKDEA